jgi:hypothetical protein
MAAGSPLLRSGPHLSAGPAFAKSGQPPPDLVCSEIPELLLPRSSTACPTIFGKGNLAAG